MVVQGVTDEDVLKPTKDYLSSIEKQEIPKNVDIITAINAVKNIDAKDTLKRIEDIRKKSFAENSLSMKNKM